ncbi:carboxypeptidase-like regulatory domain-containing protein [Ferruginibacter profundus]
MKKNTPLHITIPKPCAQSWDAMPVAGEGRHCMHCNNTIYDFSQMSDNELFDFFKQRPDTHCGRFHNTQLQRDILPLVPQRNLVAYKFTKMAAAIFAVLSFKSLSLQAGKKTATTILDADYAFKKSSTSGKLIISGTIKDSEGNPLEKATVIFDEAQVAITDKEGKFSFELPEVTATSHTLYFNYGDLITAVRNYHPAMLSTAYDVVLNKKVEGFHTMGIAIPPSEQLGALPSLLFKTNAYKLSADNKAILAAIAAKMKGVPNGTITVTAYRGGHMNPSIYAHRMDNIKKYLVEQGGISADRITTIVEDSGGDKNTIDIKSDN